MGDNRNVCLRNLILKGFTSIEKNNFDLVLVEILIKGKGNSCLIDG